MNAKQTIEAGKAVLGIEFGSTRIKAVLIDQENNPIAQGSHTWENQLVTRDDNEFELVAQGWNPLA